MEENQLRLQMDFFVKICKGCKYKIQGVLKWEVGVGSVHYNHDGIR